MPALRTGSRALIASIAVSSVLLSSAPAFAGNAYIAVAGGEDTYLTDTREALRTLIRDIKAGKADHLL
ncbi:hypothetical protein [Streptomyces sp. NPDC002156]